VDKFTLMVAELLETRQTWKV